MERDCISLPMCGAAQSLNKTTNMPCGLWQAAATMCCCGGHRGQMEEPRGLRVHMPVVMFDPKWVQCDGCWGIGAAARAVAAVHCAAHAGRGELQCNAWWEEEMCNNGTPGKGPTRRRQAP